MNVLVLNCGSSSAKFAVTDPTTGREHISGLAQRLGSPHASLDPPPGRSAAVRRRGYARRGPPEGAEVAGRRRASVLMFPDLNTGNVTYKAVQRSANVVSMGPMLQGLAKPVNELSRGCLVEDIVFTITLNAIQAHQATQRGS